MLKPSTSELARFLHHVHRADPDATLTDAAETLDALTDSELAVICRAEPGAPLCLYNPVVWEPSLRYSSELRARMVMEMDELELALPCDYSVAFTRRLLGERLACWSTLTSAGPVRASPLARMIRAET